MTPEAEFANRDVVCASAEPSALVRPCSSVRVAAPPSAGFGDSRPWMPPFAASPARIAAPELVPGLTKASIRNSASGLNTEIRISTTPTTEVPMAEKSLPRPVAIPVVNWFASPKTSTITTGANAAAWNHRSDFQNRARPASPIRPAAAIGVVAASTISAAARASRTRKWPIAAITTKKPMKPSTVATVASVISPAPKGSPILMADQASAFRRDCISERVSPDVAAISTTP
ncbi:hypothetical protein [Propioniciclava flava]